MFFLISKFIPLRPTPRDNGHYHLIGICRICMVIVDKYDGIHVFHICILSVCILWKKYVVYVYYIYRCSCLFHAHRYWSVVLYSWHSYLSLICPSFIYHNKLFVSVGNHIHQAKHCFQIRTRSHSVWFEKKMFNISYSFCIHSAKND